MNANKEDVAKRFGINLKQLREEKGLTPTELAKLTGILRPNIHRYETGKVDPQLSSALNIAIALGVSIERMLEE